MPPEIADLIPNISIIAVVAVCAGLFFTVITIVGTILLIRFIRKKVGPDRSILENGIPAKAKILVPTDRAPKNKYGNLTRANRERFIQGKGKYFTAGQREKKTPGIYLRASGRIEPMAFYVDQARYRAILPVQDIAKGVVRYKFDRRFTEALKRALSTAR